jgi:hypothetical protein
MPDIMVYVACLRQCLDRTALGRLSLSLISVKHRTSYPVMLEQLEKQHTATAPEVSKKTSSGKRGRPKGSKNQQRRDIELSPYLRFVQATSTRVLQMIGTSFRHAVSFVLLSSASCPITATNLFLNVYSCVFHAKADLKSSPPAFQNRPFRGRRPSEPSRLYCHPS